MTLQQIIEQAVAEAFAAGAEWHAIVQARQDSVAVVREARAWQKDRRYQLMLRRHQRQATEAVGRELTRLIMATHEPRHGTLGRVEG